VARSRRHQSTDSCRRLAEPVRDRWAEWLLERRHGGDPEDLKSTLDFLIPVRDRVLRNAALTGGEILLDVGAGDGLVAFGTLEIVGEGGRVHFSDISQDLLDHSRSLARQMGVLDRCEFVHASADDLSALEDASLDVVTTRSVLIYVKDKQRAFEEFHRVLKPGDGPRSSSRSTSLPSLSRRTSSEAPT
jgi:arsenite methyltransferase